MPKIKEPLNEIDMTAPKMWEYVKQVYGKEHYEKLLLISKLLWIRHTYKTEEWMNDRWN